ncbi:MAG TPA: family 1 encapsulin nanocompartment shell protein, partial [Kofleriaceae bacterium]|nr:family 1 encapsulin nanocompartment shell protein [Kofleriaceae bacterium]
IFTGVADVGVGGMLEETPHPRIPIETSADYPRAAAHAANILRKHGIDGPYALVLGPALYEDVFANADDGYPLAKRLRHLVEDRVVRAPEMTGGALVAVRGGDYQLSLGQDLSIGYASHDARTVHLFIVESFTFRVLEPAAAVPLQRSG